VESGDNVGLRSGGFFFMASIALLFIDFFFMRSRSSIFMIIEFSILNDLTTSN
jgi:hypothetical protein